MASGGIQGERVIRNREGVEISRRAFDSKLELPRGTADRGESEREVERDEREGSEVQSCSL